MSRLFILLRLFYEINGYVKQAQVEFTDCSKVKRQLLLLCLKLKHIFGIFLDFFSHFFLLPALGHFHVHVLSQMNFTWRLTLTLVEVDLLQMSADVGPGYQPNAPVADLKSSSKRDS